MMNQSESGQIFYEVSRRPGNKHKKAIIPAGKPLFTPSGGRVPPAWTSLWVTTDPGSSLQAMGRDSKNRRVYLYSSEYTGKANEAKFVRLKEFSKAYPKLMRRIKRDMQTSEEALVLYLIAKTGFRIGGNKETRAAAKAYGASTLQCTHVDVDENKLAFTFTGKKGTSVYKELKDRFLAEAVNRRCEDSNLRNIFKTNDDKIRGYLDKISGNAGFTVKDFRTYVGTIAALRKIKTMPFPRSAREFKHYRKEVGRAVGQELGNTPTIALKSYVAPEVFCTWEGEVGIPGDKPGGTSKDFFECVHYDRNIPTLTSNEDSGKMPLNLPFAKGRKM